MLTSLLELIDLIKEAGATIINETEIPNYETTVSPNGWNWYNTLSNLKDFLINFDRLVNFQGLRRDPRFYQ